MSRPFRHTDSGNLRDDGTVTAAGLGQVCIPTADKNMQFRKLKAIKTNQVCLFLSAVGIQTCPKPAAVTVPSSRRLPESV